MNGKNLSKIVLALVILCSPLVFAQDSNVSLIITNTGPSIILVTPPAAQTPISCALKTIPAAVFRAYDSDGYLDINNASAYVNYTNGAITYVASTCVPTAIDENTTEFSCTGVQFNYTDTAGSWTLTARVNDTVGVDGLNASTSMTYNTLVSMTATSLITFGTLDRGTNDNRNTNSPDYNLTNCGNTALNTSITGMNITNGTAVNWIPAYQFRVSNSSTVGVGTELTLSTVAQNYIKSGGGITIGTYWNLWYYANIPSSQAVDVYNTGYWTWTPSAA
jgi:hypothetical protein